MELTLKTYIAANRSTSITADRLHIHPNTLYHRIRKIEDLLRVDLSEPNDWLTLLLACHLRETY
jgi:DNA-binding PucR family transcriptional regulator